MAATPVDRALVPGVSGHHGPGGVATSPEVQGRLQVRREQILALRRLLVLADALCTLALVGVGMATGRQLASATAVGVLLVVVAHVCTADSPRSIVAALSVVKAALTVSGAACVLVALLGSRADARQILLGAVVVVTALITVRAMAWTPRLAPRCGLGLRRRLIVGDPQALDRAVSRRPQTADSTDEIILVVTRAEKARSSDPISGESPPVEEQRGHAGSRSGGPTGLVERVVRTALEKGAERVTVIPGSSWQQQQLRELSWLLEGTGIDMVISTSLDGIAPHRVDVVQLDGRLMIRIGSASPRGAPALAKGAIDRLGAATLLLLSAPFLLAIAIAVRAESKGPAIFRQTRVREGGGAFTMYKFRTMTPDAERLLTGLQELNMHGSDRPLFKMEEDPRITRVGQVLRKTSLDELPQLLNVLKGQMSLIGPRPALPIEVEMYDYVARRRLAVKPGMTGLWQVSGRSRLSWEESIGFDLDYVDNWSPSADAAIAMRTFRAVITKDGAF